MHDAREDHFASRWPVALGKLLEHPIGQAIVQKSVLVGAPVAGPGKALEILEVLHLDANALP